MSFLFKSFYTVECLRQKRARTQCPFDLGAERIVRRGLCLCHLHAKIPSPTRSPPAKLSTMISGPTSDSSQWKIAQRNWLLRKKKQFFIFFNIFHKISRSGTSTNLLTNYYNSQGAVASSSHSTHSRS